MARKKGRSKPEKRSQPLSRMTVEEAMKRAMEESLNPQDEVTDEKLPTWADEVAFYEQIMEADARGEEEIRNKRFGTVASF